MMQRIQLRGDLDPAKFYALVDMIQKVKASERPDALKELEDKLKGLCEVIDRDVESLTKANSAMLAELRQTTRMRNPLLPAEEQENPFADLRHTSGGQNFLRVIYDVFMAMQRAIHEMTSLTENCQPGTLTTTGRKINEIRNLEDLQFLNFEISMNQAVINRFIEGILSIAYARNLVVETGRSVVYRLESYYKALLHRHSVEGIEIHGKSPVVTDVAMSIYENIDSHGEISEDGKKPTELSAYSMRKAMIMDDAVRNGPVGHYVREPLKMIEHLTIHLQGLWALMELLEGMYANQVRDLKNLLGIKDMIRPMSGRDFNEAIEMLKDLDPQTIVFKEKTRLLTPEERFELKFRNETLKCLVELLRDGAPPPVMIEYVLGRKSAWRKYLNEENSFFVCKISAGNPFLGEAPGALQVVPGTRPNIRMEEILGMGFDEVRQHFATVEASAEWYDLFVATSPSKSGDKSHILLIGPQGCLEADTFIQYEVRDSNGRRVNHKGGAIERLYQRFNGLPQKHSGPRQAKGMAYFAPSMNDEGRIVQNRILGVIDSGEKECRRVTTRGGESIIATLDHKFYVGHGYVSLASLRVGDSVFVHRNVPFENDNPASRANRRVYLYVKHHPEAGTKTIEGKYVYKRLARARAVVEAQLNGLSLESYIERLDNNQLVGLKFLTRDMHVHHKDENFLNDNPDNLLLLSGKEHDRNHAIKNHNNLRYEVVEDEIVSIEPAGTRHTYDVQMAAPYHNVIADGIVVHNCGKSEVFRAVGGDKKSIGIFAQGSDFLTCWKGEAEKNPKRLFEGAIKIQKDTGKHVHIMIDEIDTVLNKDAGQNSFGGTNLVTEFQILMDGVVHYPHLSVWGATNVPERIPMPMLRRFSKVLVVGELSQEDRAKLLKGFAGFMPLAEMLPHVWEDLAQKLEGATGDVIRKVVDHLWRTKMTAFVDKHPTEAKTLLQSLNNGTKFSISEFTSEKRAAFHEKLRAFPAALIHGEDLERSVDMHLDNVAVHNEIKTAVETYDRARAFLASIQAKRVQA